MSTPRRIQQLLEGRQLEEFPTPDSDVAALWQKATASARDARNSTNSPDNQYVLGYQALLQMGTAVLAYAGYRTRGAQGHRATTFFAVAALQIGGLSAPTESASCGRCQHTKPAPPRPNRSEASTSCLTR